MDARWCSEMAADLNGRTCMPTAPMRAFLGFIAAAIAVLTFHQGMVAACMRLAGCRSRPIGRRRCRRSAFRSSSATASGAGSTVPCSACCMPRFTWPLWLCGLILGRDRGTGRHVHRRADEGQSDRRRLGAAGRCCARLLINGFWGLGVGLILPLLMPRSLVRAHVSAHADSATGASSALPPPHRLRRMRADHLLVHLDAPARPRRQHATLRSRSPAPA